MINPRELRIGNLVRGIDAPYPASIEGIDPNGGVFLLGDSIPWGLSEVSPIPLTEEWMVKFGFRMDVWRRYGNGQDWQPEYPRTDYRDFKRDDLVIRIETMSYISKEDKPGELVKHESKSIMVDDNHLPFRSFPEYVHSLQNLYFALTGEELTIKE
jgi:hypothetical protein